MTRGARMVAVVAVLLVAGCTAEGPEGDALSPTVPPAPSVLEAEAQPPSALVARPAPVSRLGQDAAAVSDLERSDQLRDALDAETIDSDTLLALPGDVLFAFDEAVVTAAGRDTLADVAELIGLEAPPAVRVEGHTDSVGSPDYNQGLSERRARAAAQVLVEQGIDVSLLEVTGFGQERPVASNTHPDGSDDPEGRQRNRRVEVILVDR